MNYSEPTASRTVEGAKALRSQLEENIRVLILEFQRQTGLLVACVDLERTQMDLIGKSPDPVLRSVTATVVLPEGDL